MNAARRPIARFARHAAVALLAAAGVATTAHAQAVNPLAAPGTQPANPLAAPAGGQPAANPLIAAPAANAVPPFLRAGTRIYYHAGDSVVHNHLEWFQQNGNRLLPKKGMNTGGTGILALDVLAGTPARVAVDLRMYAIGDIGGGRQGPRYTIHEGFDGNLDRVTDYWVNPAVLAMAPEGRDATGSGVTRTKIEYGGLPINAISFLSLKPKAMSSLTYDLDSGLLLVASTFNEGDPVKIAGGIGRGPRAITHRWFAGMRRVEVPWAAEPAPAWAARGSTLTYAGTFSAATPGSPVYSYPEKHAVTIDAVGDGVAETTFVASRDVGLGHGLEDTTIHPSFGSATFGGLWVSPRGVAALKAGQVVDEDRLLGRRITFAGVENGQAVFVEDAPAERWHFAYDPQSGMLTSYSKTARTGQATEVISVRLADRR